MATVLRCLVALFAVALLRSGGPAPASAQQSGAYQQALSQLAAGDTLAALESLRLVTKDDPGFAPGWGLLGIVLTQRASSVLSDFVERRDAEAALRRALKLDSDNPLYTLGLGLLLRKQSRIHDSNRLISRALESIPRAPELLGPIELEEYHLLWRLMVLRGARQAQREFESLRRDSLAWHSQEPDCFERVGQICLSWVPPQTLCKEHESLRAARNGLIDSLRTANAAIPGGDGWITGQLVRYLVEAGRSTEALEIADLCGQAPPWWGSALAGYVYQTTGQFDRADSLRQRAWRDAR